VEHLQGLLQRDQARPAAERQIKQLTYHSAKGLQADAVFLLGDCQHVTRSPYKNQVYRLAGLGKAGEAEAYDKAQQDETLRLAYVAVTRAVSHCYWYVEPPVKDTPAQPRASDHVAGDKPFFDDLRASTV
ncbi:3'-5' exonuclease, partial [Pseudomonas sp.]